MFEEFSYALIWLFFIFLMTATGALIACLFPVGATSDIFTVVSGFSCGIMLSASVWSLLIPAIENSAFSGGFAIIEAVSGFLVGGAFMVAVTKFLPENGDREKGSFKRLFIAVTAHNVPEGLAVGFAFGAVGKGDIALASAIGVALGIGIQNLPEGTAVSLPARKFLGKGKALLYGVSSGLVEPIAGVIGFFAVGVMSEILPALMSFAGGAMVFASVNDVIPDALEKSRLKTAIGVMIGFALMMSLDVVFG